MTIILLLIIQTQILSAPPSGSVVIFESQGVNPYEKLWNAVCKVESNCNPSAIGDKHLDSYSYGIAQIRQSRLDDYFNRTRIRFELTEMFDTVKSKQVFMFYAGQFRHNDYRNIAKKWNGSGKATEKYWRKVKKLI